MRPLFHKLMTSAAVVAASFFAATVASAAPTPLQSAVVDVVCDTRLGTGALTSLNDGGYVVTVGHVAINPTNHVQATQCAVGFVTDDTLEPTTYYRATVEHAVFDERVSRDYAVLKLGEKLSGKGSMPSVTLKTDEFASIGDHLTAYGFPEGSKNMKTSEGSIKNFRRGAVVTDAAITQGYSGGPAVDANGNIVGIAQRVNYTDDAKTGERHIIDYEFGDVQAIIAWMDTFGSRQHDRYLTHADQGKFDNAHLVYRHEDSGCGYVVSTSSASSSLYCLLNGPYRLVFPNEAVYYSWFPDFAKVELIKPDNVAEYQLIGNVSMRAGSLVKIQTDPKVYVVTDSIGTIRWVPTEDLAKTLFGDNWAKQVRDVPVEFFLNYHIADPLQ
jgi:hypothetical protein